MRAHPLIAGLVVAAATSGCGDTLLGPKGLEGLTDAEGPETPAWELRAFAGPGQGFVSPCALLPVSSADVYEDGLPFGWIDVLEPTPGEPAMMIETERYRYAVAVAIVHDVHGSARMVRSATIDTPLDGVWGAVGTSVLLWVDGDVDALTVDLDIVQDAPVQTGWQWVELLRWEEAFAGSFESELWMARSPSAEAAFVPVDTTEALPPAISDIVTGRNPSGVVFEACE